MLNRASYFQVPEGFLDERLCSCFPVAEYLRGQSRRTAMLYRAHVSVDQNLWVSFE